MNLIVIDANVWIRFARNKDHSKLIQRLAFYEFIPVVNNYLLSEIFDALVTMKWMDIHEAARYTNVLQRISLVTAENAVFAMSKDPKDNYLFDLAIQNNCVFIISDDKKLSESIVNVIPIRSSKWFLNSFPL
jgi:putative PIN family toxin of toxin-antitoxin system